MTAFWGLARCVSESDLWSVWLTFRAALGSACRASVRGSVAIYKHLRIAVIVATSALRHYVFSSPDKPVTCTVESVHALNEDPEEVHGYHRDLTLFFDPDAWPGRAWEALVSEATGWKDFRAEIRYAFGSHKYRMILHRGDSCPAFPLECPTRGLKMPAGVLSAALVGPKDRITDVTRRVVKYQGPRGDFHGSLGLHVRVKEMFPFDDHDDNVRRFTDLKVIDACARSHVYKYALNERMTGSSHESSHTDSQKIAGKNGR